MLNLLILGTGSVTLGVVAQCLADEEIHVVGVIPDGSVDPESNAQFAEKVKQLNVPVLDFCEESFQEADMIFSPEYRKIVPGEYTRKYKFINCHGGILPYYRGFAANAWAIMNGSDEIGYSFHEVNEKLDDGVIYFVDRIKLLPEQTYADVHHEMVQRIIMNAPVVLKEVHQGSQTGVKQTGKRIYCTRFSPEMGNISDFHVPSDYIYRLYKCMAKPLGTGLYFMFKGTRYNVDRVALGSAYDIDDYIGIPGKIVNIEDNALWVKTQDNVIVFSAITDETGNPVDVYRVFRNGNKL